MQRRKKWHIESLQQRKMDPFDVRMNYVELRGLFRDIRRARRRMQRMDLASAWPTEGLWGLPA
jgi:hypothetical protein